MDETFEEMAVECSTAELAKYLNITQKQLRTLQQNGVLKRIGHNRWNPTQCAHLYIKYLQESQGQSNFEKYREQHMKAKAEVAEIQAMELKGEVAYVDELHAEYEDLVLQLRTKLLQLPRRLSTVSVPRESRGREIIWRRALHDALKEIASDDGVVKPRKNSRKSKKAAQKDRTAPS